MKVNGFFLLFIYFKFNASNHEKQTIGREERTRRKKSRQKKNTGKHNFHLKLKQFAGLLRTVWAQKKIIAKLKRERGRQKKKSEKRDWKMFFLTLMKPIRKQQPANQLCNKFLFLYAFHSISLIHRLCRHWLLFFQILFGVCRILCGVCRWCRCILYTRHFISRQNIYWSLKADLKSIKQYFYWEIPLRSIYTEFLNGELVIERLQRIKLSEWHFFCF